MFLDKIGLFNLDTDPIRPQFQNTLFMNEKKLGKRT